MDEYNSGMDPEVRKYFRKIINSFSACLFWLLSVVTAGLFFHLGFVDEGLKWYNLVFYFLFLLTFAALLRYLYRLWGKRKD